MIRPATRTWLTFNLVVHYQVTDPEAAIFVVGVDDAAPAAKWDELVRAASEAGFRAEMAQARPTTCW